MRGQDDRNVTVVGRGQDLWELVVAYAKQETTDPLKGLGRWLSYGAGGSTLIAVGVLLLTMALLRALQTETGDLFDGNWSWVPYLITLLAAGAVGAVAFAAVNRRKNRAEQRR